MEQERSRSPNEERWFGYVRRLFRRLQQLQDRVEFLEGTVTQLMQEQRDLNQLFRQQHTRLLAQQHHAAGGTIGGGPASAMLPAPAPAAQAVGPAPPKAAPAKAVTLTPPPSWPPPHRFWLYVARDTGRKYWSPHEPDREEVQYWLRRGWNLAAPDSAAQLRDR